MSIFRPKLLTFVFQVKIPESNNILLSAGITKSVIADQAISQNTIVKLNPAQNLSSKARGNTQNTVVSVVSMIGCSRLFPASRTDMMGSSHNRLLAFIRSIKIMASFTTTHVSAINPIPNGIEYGFPVRKSPIFTPKSASITEYSMITGCVKLLKSSTNMTKIRSNAITNDTPTATRSS